MTSAHGLIKVAAKTSTTSVITSSVSVSTGAATLSAASPGSVTSASQLQLALLDSKTEENHSSRMQPTLPQTAGTADMDLTAVQSMDWFFKKEQIYLLAQFWQQHTINKMLTYFVRLWGKKKKTQKKKEKLIRSIYSSSSRYFNSLNSK
uniref:Uncharacterized protein n=1 Tax=Glossina morsitans morsitans TaxID=37546 RepID=A0A1B0FCZ7_GLOMM